MNAGVGGWMRRELVRVAAFSATYGGGEAESPHVDYAIRCLPLQIQRARRSPPACAQLARRIIGSSKTKQKHTMAKARKGRSHSLAVIPPYLYGGSRRQQSPFFSTVADVHVRFVWKNGDGRNLGTEFLERVSSICQRALKTARIWWCLFMKESPFTA